MPTRTIDAPTLKSLLDKGEAVLVDVREPAEFRAEHIPGAVSVPLSQISVSSLPAFGGKTLVVQCLKGGRGASACEKLLGENPSLALCNLQGGIGAWTAAGFATNRASRAMLPLDRQVQLTIGLCVLLGSVLGYMVDRHFFLLTGFFGAGLTFAGLTGFCGLALLMAKMPWNK